jgi:threonine dehydrogenase-like Zn-dependent dehydrogenase
MLAAMFYGPRDVRLEECPVPSVSAGQYAQALNLIITGRVDVEALVTERVPLSSMLDVIHRLLQKQGVKYALIPPAFAQSLLHSTGLA